MRPVFERDHARAWARIGGFAALTLVVSIAACFSGSNKDLSQPSGIIGPTGGGGSKSGGGNSSFGTYRLATVDDSAVPFVLDSDSVSGSGAIGDTTRVFVGTIDSSFISLNADTTAEEIDYLTIVDHRTALDSSFVRDITFGDTTFGTYSVSSGATVTVTVSLTDTVGGSHMVTDTYTDASHTLTGTIFYQLYNTTGSLAAQGQATYVYDYTGPPFAERMRPNSGDAAAARQPIAVLRGHRVGPITRAGITGAGITGAGITDAGIAPRRRVWRVPASLLAASRAPLAPARTRP